MFDWIQKVFCIDSFKTPILINQDSDYLPELKNRFSLLINKLEENNAPNDILSNVKKEVDSVISTLDDYYKGNIISAQSSILDIIKSFSCNRFAKSHIYDACSFKRAFIPQKRDNAYNEYMNTEVNFFRARLSNTSTFFDYSEMLHIGFDQRDIVSTQRFSIPGLPCLYLGTSTYDCWIEMSRPADNEFNVSAVQVDNSLNIFNLGIDSLDLLCTDLDDLRKNGQWDFTYFQDLISIWILSFATSFVIKNSRKAFHSEYIISQLIMLAVKALGLDGIAYYSKQLQSDAAALPACVNLAIFAHFTGEKKLSKICKKIHLSDAVNYAEFKQLFADGQCSTKPLWVDHSYPVKVDLAGQRCSYGKTLFHQFDKYLLNLPSNTCNIDRINNTGILS